MQGQSWEHEAVVEALVREHLTRKQFTRTLAEYKAEQPAIQQPINKRSILLDLLGLSSTQGSSPVAAGKHTSDKGDRGGCSVLELLVQGKIFHSTPCFSTSNDTRQAFSRVGGSTGTAVCGSSTESQAAVHCSPAATAPPAVSSRYFGQQQQHKAEAGQASWRRRLQPLQHQGTAAVQPGSASVQQHFQQMQPAGGDTCPLSAHAAATALSKGVEELVICDVDVDSMTDDTGSASAPDTLPAAAQQGAAVPHRLTTVAAEATAAAGWRPRTPGDSSCCPAGWLPNSANSSSSGPLPVSCTAPVRGVGAAGFEALSPEQQRQLLQLVWGGGSVQPEAAWQQGLLWCGVEGMEWGLLQLSGGPCGVLAAVQAHLIATLMQMQLWSPAAPVTAAAADAHTAAALTPEQLQEVLVHSLALMLWACATGGASSGSSSGSSNSCAYVVTLSASGSSAGVRGLFDAGQLLQMVQASSARNLQETEGLVRAVLPQWCQRKGWGVLLLLYSALLSRGCSAVVSDMDGDTRLVDGLGYCSMELVNLLLTGCAVSNVFDGSHSFEDTGPAAPAHAGPAAAAAAAVPLCGSKMAGPEGALVIRGISQQARVGLLTLFEWYRYLEVGQHLKSPQWPVWVVCSESHFSVLALGRTAGRAAVDTGSLQPAAGAPLLLWYHDGLAKQEGPIVLEVVPAAGGQGWSSRMQGVAEERGVWRGCPIPPLECVIETRWRDVHVVWHGSEPIL